MRCYTCQGRKVYYPLGGISKTCSACDGVGYVESQPIILETIESVPILDDNKKASKEAMHKRLAEARAKRKQNKIVKP